LKLEISYIIIVPNHNYGNNKFPHQAPIPQGLTGVQ